MVAEPHLHLLRVEAALEEHRRACVPERVEASPSTPGAVRAGFNARENKFAERIPRAVLRRNHQTPFACAAYQFIRGFALDLAIA
jgi:hypothetical protein